MKKTQYDFEFYNNSLARDNGGNSSSAGGNSRGIRLGGAELTPGLILTNSANEGKEEEIDIRGTLEKQIDIVEYLKKLPVDSKVFSTFYNSEFSRFIHTEYSL